MFLCYFEFIKRKLGERARKSENKKTLSKFIIEKEADTVASSLFQRSKYIKNISEQSLKLNKSKQREKDGCSLHISQEGQLKDKRNA